MVLGFSTLMALVFVLAAAPISQGLFGNTDYQGLVRLVALVQMGIALGQPVTGVDERVFAMPQVMRYL